MNRIRRWLVSSALFVLIAPSMTCSAVRERRRLDELYGQGVHAFFAAISLKLKRL